MDRIHKEFEEFCRRVDLYADKLVNLEDAEPSLMDALNWLYSLTERIKKELKSGSMNKEQKSACHAVLDDPFIQGQLQLRRLATAVSKKI